MVQDRTHVKTHCGGKVLECELAGSWLGRLEAIGADEDTFENTNTNKSNQCVGNKSNQGVGMRAGWELGGATRGNWRRELLAASLT